MKGYKLNVRGASTKPTIRGRVYKLRGRGVSTNRLTVAGDATAKSCTSNSM